MAPNHDSNYFLFTKMKSLDWILSKVRLGASLGVRQLCSVSGLICQVFRRLDVWLEVCISQESLVFRCAKM
jgi:hypothetical protein